MLNRLIVFWLVHSNRVHLSCVPSLMLKRVILSLDSFSRFVYILWLLNNVTFIEVFVWRVRVNVDWELLQTLCVETWSTGHICSLIHSWGTTGAIDFGQFLGCIGDLIIPSNFDFVIFNDYILRPSLRIDLRSLFLILLLWRRWLVVWTAQKLIKLFFFLDLLINSLS
jgi:hypothetical protein